MGAGSSFSLGTAAPRQGGSSDRWPRATRGQVKRTMEKERSPPAPVPVMPGAPVHGHRLRPPIFGEGDASGVTHGAPQPPSRPTFPKVIPDPSAMTWALLAGPFPMTAPRFFSPLGSPPRPFLRASQPLSPPPALRGCASRRRDRVSPPPPPSPRNGGLGPAALSEPGWGSTAGACGWWGCV